MRTTAIILIVLFLFAAIFLGIALLERKPDTAETETDIPLASEETPVETVDTEEIQEEEAVEAEDEEEAETPELTEEEIEEILSEQVQEVEIYLDGTKENGIFLGTAEHGLESEEMTLVYGDEHINSGFSLSIENRDYEFEPGSTHYIYIYANIPKYGWDYKRKEVNIPGDLGTSENVKLYIDSLSSGTISKGDVSLSGWSANLSVADSTGIERIEFYIDGPRGFGKSLGEPQYGILRQDVANAYGNANYANSGYDLTFDAGGLEPGSSHSIFGYAFSTTGEYQVVRSDVVVEGQYEEPNIAMQADIELGAETIEVSGWIANKDLLVSGVQREVNIEYDLKRLVFVSNASGNEDIWSMNLDGSELTQLTDYEGVDQYPAVSPDGKKIVYSSDIKGSWQIVVMDWDGSNKKQLTFNPERNGYPTWSFDSRYIYFEMFINGDWEIYRMDSDGSNFKRLTFNNSSDDWHPFAHPFEDKVLFESGKFGNEDIYIVDSNGDNLQKISNSQMRFRVPKMSIDGKKIVFMGYNGNQSDIYMMNADGGGINMVVDSAGNAGLPCFSPDNKNIVFNAKVGNQDEVFLMSVDGSGLVQLTSIPGDDWGAVFMYQVKKD